VAVLLKPPSAGSLIVVPRMPAPVAAHTGDPFTTPGHAVVDCDVPGCDWHAVGERADVKKAWQEHYRQKHGSAQEVGVLSINHPRHQ